MRSCCASPPSEAEAAGRVSGARPTRSRLGIEAGGAVAPRLTGERREAKVKISEVEGIDGIYAEKLVEAGITTTEALLERGSTPRGPDGDRVGHGDLGQADPRVGQPRRPHAARRRRLRVRRPPRGRRRGLPGGARAPQPGQPGARPSRSSSRRGRARSGASRRRRPWPAGSRRRRRSTRPSPTAATRPPHPHPAAAPRRTRACARRGRLAHDHDHDHRPDAPRRRSGAGRGRGTVDREGPGAGREGRRAGQGARQAHRALGEDQGDVRGQLTGPTAAA